MIIGMSTETEVCQLHRQDSQDSRKLNETLPKGYMWSGRRLTKIHTTSRSHHIWPDAWTRIGKAAQKREAIMGYRETKTPLCRNLTGIYSIDPSDKNYKDIIKNARRKLETPTATGTPCKRESSKASIRKTVIPKTRKFKESGADIEVSCIDEMDESTNSEEVRNYAQRFLRGHWTFIICRSLMGNGTPWQHECYNDLKRQDVQYSEVSVLSESWSLEKKENKNTFHFSAETSDVELLFRIIHSANQIRVYGAVSSWSGQSSPAGDEPFS